MENSNYLPLDVSVIASTKLYFRIQHINEIEWCVIVSPCNYDDIINAVKKLFPTLENSEFTLQDEFGANLRGDFLEEYIKISSRGVLLKVREPQLHSLSSASTLTNYSFNNLESSPQARIGRIFRPGL